MLLNAVWTVKRVTECIKTRYFEWKKSKKNSGEGHSPIPRPLPYWGAGYPLPKPHPLDAFDVSILVPLARGPPYYPQCPPAWLVAGDAHGSNAIISLNIPPHLREDLTVNWKRFEEKKAPTKGAGCRAEWTTRVLKRTWPLTAVDELLVNQEDQPQTHSSTRQIYLERQL